MPGFLRSRTGLAFAGFLLVAGYLLVTEHEAHARAAVAYLPWLLLLACPLLHLLVHGGHGGPDRGDRVAHEGDRSGAAGKGTQS